MNLHQTILRRISSAANLFLLTLVLTVTMQAQSSSVDLSFNATPSRESGSVGNFVLQPDGKILILGGTFVVNGVAKNQVVRLNSDGSSDNSFNCAACDFNIGSAVVQPDGKIIVAGSALSPVSGSYPAIVKRLNSDGSIDNSFVPLFAAPPPPASSSARVWAIQPEGKIIVSTSSTFSQGLLSYPPQGFALYTIYRLNVDGSFDNTFVPIASSSGSTIFSYINKIALQADGKILVSSSSREGSQSVGRIQRYNTEGTTDSTFEVPTLMNSGSSNNSTFIYDFDIQPDGKIVFVGQFATVNAVERVKIARLLPTGQIDLSFVPANSFPSNANVLRVKVLSNGQILAGSGQRLLRFNSDGSLDNTFNAPSDLSQVGKWDVDAAGRILLSGIFNGIGTSPSKFVRLNLDGSLDNSFNTDFEAPGTIEALAIQTDGKIIVSGYYTRINGIPQKNLARLNPDGSLDSTFNSGTRFSTGAGYIGKILIQPDGKILIIGSFIANDGMTRTQVARLNTNGSPDTSFDTIVYSENRSVSTIALQADGKILIGGYFTKVNGADFTGLARLNPDGSVDSSFYPIFSGGISSLAVQTDGKIMVGGSFTTVNGFSRKNLVRLNADGTLDSSFTADSIGSADQIEIQADGKYVVLISRYRIIRLNSNGTTDTSFQSVYFSTNIDVVAVVREILIQPDGSIIVVGFFASVNGVPRLNIARLKPDGNLDNTFFPNGAYGDIRTIDRQADGKIIVGGSFTKVADVTRIGIARLTIVPFRQVIPFDFDGDGKSDISVFRPSNGFWYIMKSSGGYSSIQWGRATDELVPGDYDGDGKTDVAVFRYFLNFLNPDPTENTWYIQRSADNTFVTKQLGRFPLFTSNEPVPADYDGDGKTDLAVYDVQDYIPAQGNFRILQSSTDTRIFKQWGFTTDKRVSADYDGDGKADIAVFRYNLSSGSTEAGIWFILQSSNGAVRVERFGLPTDRLVPADYDGDGKADLAVYRPSNGFWYILGSRDGFRAMQFGVATDKPTPADYDGDGKTDIAVFRPSNGTWYLQRSTEGFAAYRFGFENDIPIPNVYVR